MAQVETQSAFRHSSQHNSYYYPSASPSHSGSSSSSNSHHSSPRSAAIVPQRYYSPSQYYEDHASAYQQHSSVNPTYRTPYSQQQSSRSIEEDNADNAYNPFPAYEYAMPSHTLAPTAIEDEDGEGDYDDEALEDDDDAPLESPNSLKSSSPSAIPHISDDIWTERGPGPSRQVDYLSHDWTEPDIWSSWRYVRKEKAGYPQNAARLENASWRTWAKSKYKLKTITPETLNWLKDCDVTWLYGPLQSQGGTLANSLTKVTLEPMSPAISEPDMQRSRSRSRSSSFSAPSKPILKKRSHSEVMLTSLSGKTHGNLLTRAAQAVQDERRRELEEQELREEQRKNPLTPAHVIRSHQRMRRKGSTDITTISYPESPFTVQDTSSRHTSIVAPVRTDYFGTGHWTSSSSGGQTPSTSKHIHFNDRVEQCIAVDVKDDDEVVVEEDESEDEGLFMGKAKHHVPKPEQHSTIAKLPATTLRPGDEPIREPPQIAFNISPPSRQSLSRQSKDDSAIIESSGFYYDEGGAFSSSASPPNFPPTHYSPDGEIADDFSFDHPFASQSISENISNNSSAHTSTASSRRSSNLSFDMEEESQRRASVAAIPIPTAHRVMNTRDHGGLMGEEDEEGMGFVGLAADAISTAKDLVGVLWNAGWGGRR